ncbi:MAG: hypothetical protein JW922_02010, partial [Paludibacteraceae bacterium]|nr:hypothetical protein [Paludibacteraceae bacterium]
MIMPILYFTSLILVGISLGSLIYLGYKDTKLTGFSRFLIGFSLTPFAISLFTLSFGLVFNKAHQLWFFIIPIVISVIYLKLFGEPGIKGFFEDVKNYWTKLSLIDKLLWVPMLEFIILILVVIVKVTYSYPIVEAHDAGVYMNEALHFVEERKIPNFSTANEGLSPGHPHSALYMGYLANGLFASGNETFGFPNDKIAIVGARLILIFLIAATFSLLHNIEELKKYLALPFLIYFLLNPVNNLILFFMDNISRDPFRIIPLILLFTVTSSYLRVVKNYRFLLRDYLLILTLTTFGIWGHTINIIIVGLIILTWIFLSFYSKRETKLVVSVVFSVAFGFCIAGIHYLRSFIDTGRLMGNGFYYYFWEGTALWDAFTNTTRYNSRLNLNLIERLRNLLMLNDAYGYIVIFVIVFFLIKKLK